MATSRRDLMNFDNVPFSTAVILNLPQLQGCCVIQAHIYCLLPAVLVGLHKDRVLRKLLQQSQSSGRLAVVATNITLGDTGELSPRSFRDNRHFSNDICGILFSLYQIGVSQTLPRDQLLYLLPLKLPQTNGLYFIKNDIRWYSQPIPFNHQSYQASHSRGIQIPSLPGKQNLIFKVSEAVV